jgi:hypothetical protein
VSAFILYHAEASLDLASAEGVFLRKGLNQPEKKDLGSWKILLYRKMLSVPSNSFCSTDGKYSFCVGTVSYRLLGYKDSLERIHSDFFKGCLDKDNLIGNFCIGLWDGHKLALLVDNLFAQHIFYNDRGDCLSTSFLATLAASPTPLSLNKMAVHEKLATGYIVAPDTLVVGISQLNYENSPWFEHKTGIKILNDPPIDGCDDFHVQGFKESVHSHASVLEKYFNKIDLFACESNAELGLSSGYDSRLLLALSQFFSKRISLHSHYTINVHESELAIARQLASIGGNELTVIPTKRIEDELEERRREIMSENLYFFDGRCIHDMGHCSETYTAQYRKMVLGNNRLSLHGLGGELCRNAYKTPSGRFSWTDWLDYAVFFPFAKEVCNDKDAFIAMRQARNEKVAKRLGLDLSGNVDSHATRRYYGLVRMPDCASNVSNAYNQVAFVLTPFIESQTVREVLKASPYIGVNGEYEAALIRELAPRLASVGSQYGHDFTTIPIKNIIKAKVNASLPLQLRAMRRRRLCSDVRRDSGFERFKNLRMSSACIREVEEIMRTTFPKADSNYAMYDDSQRRTALYVGSFLLEFQKKITL